MSTDFENDLRERLHNSAAPDLGIDTDALLASGRRQVTRRNLLAGGVAAGALATVGLGAGMVTWRLPLDVKPADGGTWVTVDLPRLTDPQGKEHAGEPKFFRVKVRTDVDPADEQMTEATMKFFVAGPDGGLHESMWAGGSWPTDGSFWSNGSTTGNYVIGAVADRVTQLMPVGDGPSTQLVKPVPGLNLSVFLVRFGSPEAAGDMSWLYYTDEAGTIRLSNGQVAPSVEFAAADRGGLPAPATMVFLDGTDNCWGVRAGTERWVVLRTKKQPTLMQTTELGGVRLHHVVLGKGAGEFRLEATQGSGKNWTVMGPTQGTATPGTGNQVSPTLDGRLVLRVHGPVGESSPTLVYRAAGQSTDIRLPLP